MPEIANSIRFGALCVASLLLLATDAHAHGGGLDDLGCHHNRRAGGYHWLWEA